MEMTFIKTTSANLNQIPVVDGQLIVASDTSQRYLDFENVREGIASQDEIEAIVNVYGCCNILRNDITSTAESGVTITSQSDGRISLSGTAVGNLSQTQICNDFTLPAGNYVLSAESLADGIHVQICNKAESQEYVSVGEGVPSRAFTVTPQMVNDMKIRFASIFSQSTVVNVLTGVMIHDARLKPTGYVPYAMTNRELTEKVVTIEYKELTSDYIGWVNVPYDGRTIISTIGSSGYYGLVRDFDPNHTNQRIQLYACDPNVTDPNTWNVARNTTVTLGLVYLID